MLKVIYVLVSQVFFEWRGPSSANTDDGRVVITETGNSSTAVITPLFLQVIGTAAQLS